MQLLSALATDKDYVVLIFLILLSIFMVTHIIATVSIAKSYGIAVGLICLLVRRHTLAAYLSEWILGVDIRELYHEHPTSSWLKKLQDYLLLALGILFLWILFREWLAIS